MFPKYVLLSICAFIRVHFGRPGKFSQHSPFRCIHILSKTSYDQQTFSKKSWKLFLFKSMLVLYLLFSFFFSLLALSFFFYIFIMMIFICFIYLFIYFFLDDVPKQKKLYTVPESQINIIDNNDISANATIQTKMYALYK